jgi:ribonuclease P protein component
MYMLTLKKDERLCSKKIIEELFSEGKSFIIEPFRIVWIEKTLNSDSPAQVLINVSLRKFKRAVDRNKIKRLIREAYRKNKSPFYQFLTENLKQCAFAIFYISKELTTYSEIELKIILILQRLEKELKSKGIYQ